MIPRDRNVMAPRLPGVCEATSALLSGDAVELDQRGLHGTRVGSSGLREGGHAPAGCPSDQSVSFPMSLLVTRNATNTQGCLNIVFAKIANNIYGRTPIEVPPNVGIVCLGIFKATLASAELGSGHSSQRSGRHGRNHTK